MDFIKFQSPNYFRPGDMTETNIQAIVLHGTAGPVGASLSWLLNAKSKVSSNYLISKRGQIYELVSWDSGRRSWANGIVENWDRSLAWLARAVKDEINPNWITWSIEHEASETEMKSHASMTDAQFNSSIELTAFLLRKAGLKANHQTVIGHNQISGTAKFNCPGVIFPPAYTEQLVIRNPDLA